MCEGACEVNPSSKDFLLLRELRAVTSYTPRITHPVQILSLSLTRVIWQHLDCPFYLSLAHARLTDRAPGVRLKVLSYLTTGQKLRKHVLYSGAVACFDPP